LLKTFFFQLRSVFHKRRLDFELEEELQFHLEKEIQNSLERGMSPEEARYAALRSFGGVARSKEECREVSHPRPMEEFWRDLQYGARTLMRYPGFTLVALVVLTLGIGANTAIFSVVNRLLLQPLPYSEAERLVWIWGNNQLLGVNQGFLAAADISDFRKQSTQFESIAAWTTLPVNLNEDNRSERLEGILVSPGFFSCLGVGIALGRDFKPDDIHDGHNPAVIISDALWKRRFAADPAVVGRSLRLDFNSPEPYTIVGIAPREVLFPVRTDIWIADFDEAEESERSGHDLRAIGRLKDGVTFEQAQTELNSIARQLERQYPATNTGWRVSLTSVRDLIIGTPYKALWMLFAAVVCLLLIACANVAGLQIGRGAGRNREMALRAALGAGRSRIIRQLLTESILLALLGGFFGLIASWAGIQALRHFGPATIPRLQEIGTDGWVFAFSFVVTLAVGILSGILPAVQMSGSELGEALKKGSNTASASRRTSRTRALLVISQVAVTVVLLIATGLLLKSFWRIRSVDPGFSADHVLTAGISLNREKYMISADRRINFFREVTERVSSIPGVKAVGLISHLPFGGRGVNVRFLVPDHPPDSSDDARRAELRVISPGYFETLQIPLKNGRSLTDRDTTASPIVVLVNNAFARQFFPGRVPVGERLKISAVSSSFAEIVGVVADVRHKGYDADPRPEMYVSYLQNTVWPVMNVVVRSSIEPETIAAPIRAEIEAIDPSQAIFNVRPLDSFLSDSIAERRFSVALLLTFAILALVTASAGIYGLVAFTVTQRTHEIGIRMALGANSRDVLQLIMGQGMRLVALGLAAGLIAAVMTTRLISSLFFGVTALDPLTFVSVALLVAGVALLACFIPASRALKVDPMFSLRAE
jgi:putative ABC transport system permease protein